MSDKKILIVLSLTLRIDYSLKGLNLISSYQEFISQIGNLISTRVILEINYSFFHLAEIIRTTFIYRLRNCVCVCPQRLHYEGTNTVYKRLIHGEYPRIKRSAIFFCNPR